ncbi:hypothetical protein PI124_g2654 [Phytophthora idaei]|nr:hypothetical protein PI125_g8139 [Phytophthora idaei]KAG3252748.1 hypothetical protein PI124_g2654 [Phytophthora idaei]
MVVGYAWEEMFKTGVLQVTFLKETCEIPYNEDELQDLGLETYALRPSVMRDTADVMPAECARITTQSMTTSMRPISLLDGVQQQFSEK